MNQTLQVTLAVSIVTAALVVQTLVMGAAIVPFDILLALSFFFWISRDYASHPMPRRILSLYLAGIAVQCLHFYEEYLTGFQNRFPMIFGYEWSDHLFVGFNLVWLAIFTLAALGVMHRVPIASFPVWFFAIAAGLANGIGHPLLSLREGGYFPGLITSPLHLIIGILLTRELLRTDRFKSATS